MGATRAVCEIVDMASCTNVSLKVLAPLPILTQVVLLSLPPSVALDEIRLLQRPPKFVPFPPLPGSGL